MGYLFAFALLVALGVGHTKLKAARRADYIRRYMFPPGLLAKLGQQREGVGAKEEQLVARALRQFFLAYLKGGLKPVAMPSQVTDDLWHEFILYTRQYQQFCTQAFGRFLHHTPTAVMGRNRSSNEGLRRVWWHVCLEENINPRKATRLPLLFAIDSKLGLGDGFHYELDCSKRNPDGSGSNGGHCASDFSDSSIDGGTDGFGDSDSGGGDGGGDSGCGGGCGGD